MTNYKPAGLLKRLAAALIDSLLFVVLFIVIESLKSNTDYEATLRFCSFILIITFLLYTLFKDGMYEGRSLGKKRMDLWVVSMEGGMPGSYFQSFLRNIVYIIFGWIPILGPLFLLLEAILVVFTKDRRRIGDRLANTQVVEKVADNPTET
jgi:uncharacterized RDD family membrane protein YckC